MLPHDTALKLSVDIVHARRSEQLGLRACTTMIIKSPNLSEINIEKTADKMRQNKFNNAESFANPSKIDDCKGFRIKSSI
jgi:hypothetical protein|tara:strand:- start:728 stop:967 length:240 start_codon:yes stop_codon:yes gene_type:complete